MRLAIVGHGRMGRAVEALARERGHDIRGIITSGAIVDAGALNGAEVAVEFTTPTAAPANLERLLAAGVPVVTGTTGWSDHLERIRHLTLERSGAILHGPNFSIGAQLFLRAATDLARWMAGRTGFDGYLLEQHHAGKRDAPSGTAIRLRDLLRQADLSRDYPVSSIRAGAGGGHHSLVYDAADEIIRLEHSARSRAVFASGALAAAEWLRGRTGFFTFEEMLFGGDQ